MFGFIFSVGVSAFIDPYNVFHWKNIRDNGVEPNKNYIKMKYVLTNPEKFDSFLFGSSRVGSIHVEKIADRKCYNMTYSSGTPKEHLQNTQTLFEQGIYPKTIYIGIDSLSYTEDVSEHDESGIRASYEYLQNPFSFIGIYANLSSVMQAIPIVIENQKQDNFSTVFYEYGWWFNYEQVGDTEWEDEDVPVLGDCDRMNQTLEEMQQIVTLCEENNVELIVFTNPMYQVTYEASEEDGYLDFLKKLATITDYYNFSGLNDITMDKNNYIDTSHYCAEVGDQMIACMNGGYVSPDLQEQGFGVYVTKDNIDEIIDILSTE